jgi:UDP-N-acetylglucosamine--N-acetylmuramyl-(pentapeptide) pyrophosphoryl-undecaprenol N-acetylglucosamine transferase
MPPVGLTRIFLVAGGTGGHILPAVAFGRWLAEAVDGVEIVYVSGNRCLEQEIYGVSGVHPVILPCEGSPMGTRGGASAARWLQILKASGEMVRLLGQMRPEVCVLFGGYVSFPALVAGKLKGIRILVHEQNAVAGRVTRLAARLGAKLLTGWNECHPFGKDRFVKVGTPVRAMRRLPRREAWNKLDLGEFPGGRNCLVLGGSLGSLSLAERMEEISRLPDFEGWNFLVMGKETGDNHLSDRVWGIPRRWDMETLYSLADTAVVRGGASTLSELRAWAIPALVVPWPDSRDDHQSANARVFCEGGNGLVWDEVREGKAELVSKLRQLGSPDFAGQSGPACPGVAAEQINRSFFREILRTLEGRDGSWMDSN